MSRENNQIDIIFTQEPWWSCPKTITGPARSAGLTGWTPFLPKSVIKPNERPRVHAYVRSKSPMHVTQRFDIIEDLDIQILDITFYSPNPNTIRFINVYNQKPLDGNSQGNSYAVDKLRNIAILANLPTIFVGDWNIKHPRLADMPDYQPNPDARARSFSDWVDEHGLVIQNAFNQYTRISQHSGTGSVLDLMILNREARESRLVQGWSVGAEMNGGSDHYATTFSVGTPGQEILNINPNVLNWKKADRAEFVNTACK